MKSTFCRLRTVLRRVIPGHWMISRSSACAMACVGGNAAGARAPSPARDPAASRIARTGWTGLLYSDFWRVDKPNFGLMQGFVFAAGGRASSHDLFGYGAIKSVVALNWSARIPTDKFRYRAKWVVPFGAVEMKRNSRSRGTLDDSVWSQDRRHFERLEHFLNQEQIGAEGIGAKTRVGSKILFRAWRPLRELLVPQRNYRIDSGRTARRNVAGCQRSCGHQRHR